MAQTESNSYTNEGFEIEENEVTESQSNDKSEENKKHGMLYNIEDNPPWHLSLLLGFQHYLSMIGSTIAVPLILAPAMCIDQDDPTLGILISTIIFVSGIVTIMQITIGIRLPIIQGATFSFLIPVFALMNTFDSCDNFSHLTGSEKEQIWGPRVREIQGAVIVASFFQVIIGVTGLLGWFLTWITPLTIVPTITLIGLSLYESAAEKASGNWPLALMTAILLMVFAQYVRYKKVKLPVYTRKEGFKFKGFALFTFFPILLGIMISWGISGILTITDVLPANSTARTDSRTYIINEAPWVYVPYPFQFGLPSVSVSGVIGILAGIFASVIESVGDYYVCARICGVPPPPVHAINRGILIEGLGGILSGIMGTCNGTTSYSDNIGTLKITRVASRRVIFFGGLLMILFGIFGKFGAICGTIPDPVLAGIFIILFSMVTAVGLSNLQVVDLSSPRNLFVIGAPIFLGLMSSGYINDNKNAIKTGSVGVDQILTILFSSPMLIGGLLGMFLDNTIPGTREERGLHLWNKSQSNNDKHINVYDLPVGMHFIRKHSIFQRIPISPTFQTCRSIPDTTDKEHP